jgi:hypothetical protein
LCFSMSYCEPRFRFFFLGVKHGKHLLLA